MRFSVQRFFLEQSGIDIINNVAFQAANTCFQNILKDIKMSGKGSTDHHPEIEPEDMRKLYESFDIDSNFGLQEKVWVDIMLYLCRRGRENIRLMDKTTFGVGTDATGKRFVFQYNGEYDKNHGILDDGTATHTSGEGRIYETGGPKCPVKTFLSYIRTILIRSKSHFGSAPLTNLMQRNQYGTTGHL